MAMGHTEAEIVVFADANSIYDSGAVRSLVRNFGDPSVGYVTGRMVYTNPERSGIGEGSGAYMSYENTLRGYETKLGSIVGVDGGIDAVRRQLYLPMRADQLPDFILPLNVVEQGKRVVYEPEATVYESALSSAAGEFRMRVRVSLRALWSLQEKSNLLDPFKYPLFAWQLISHKVFRYLAFFPLIGLFVFNVLVLGEQDFYLWFLLVQFATYSAAALGHFFNGSSSRRSKLLAPYYFVLLNAACVVAFWKFVQGKRMVLWTPRGGA
jgi:cellulose synthase/poly-beta-1,6-N-acetylglucosamine synthase-like glycosyltransferase